MKRFALLPLIALMIPSLGAGCSSSDVPLAKNGAGGSTAGAANQSTAGESSTSQSGKGGNSNNTAGTSSNGKAGSSSSVGGDTSADAGATSTDSAGSGAGGDSSVGCSGQAPNCFGNDVKKCCGNDPAGQATCQNGQWTCFGVPAPGCSGTRCTDEFSCGPTLTCDLSKQYCHVLTGGINGDQYQCLAFPDNCQQDHSCACIATQVCQTCSVGIAGGIRQDCEVG
jgi:hypothetical protein